MRISDWSSDVCSSDLAANILGWIDRPDLDMRALVGGINLLEVGAGRGEHLTARDRVARHAAAEIMDAAGDLFLIAFAEKVDRRDNQPLAARVQLLVADARDQPDIADRSEEHTSELQSLMRISYAVFCLKKKKPIQKNQTH